VLFEEERRRHPTAAKLSVAVLRTFFRTRALSPRVCSCGKLVPEMLLAWFMISACSTIALCIFGARLATKLGLLDHPGGRKRHARPTPLLGGLVVVLVLTPLAALLMLISPDESHLITSIVATTLFITLLAIADDRSHINPLARLLITIGIFSVAVFLNPDLRLGMINWNGNALGFGLGVFAASATILCLTTLINGVNLADGKNGLVLGMMTGWIVILGVASPPSLHHFIGVVGGCLIILLIFNLQDRLFLGDGGSYGFAALIGLLSVYVYQHSTVLKSADQVGLMFMIPVGDMIRLMAVRRFRGDSPFTPDRDHLHHLLLDRLGWRGGLIVYLALVLVPVAVALAVPHAALTIIASTFLTYWMIIILSHRAKSIPHPSLPFNVGE